SSTYVNKRSNRNVDDRTLEKQTLYARSASITFQVPTMLPKVHFEESIFPQVCHSIYSRVF
ncbi:unnamed protein product, partial [Nesidiocoris tenuis]